MGTYSGYIDEEAVTEHFEDFERRVKESRERMTKEQEEIEE
jgi:hypothetical protein